MGISQTKEHFLNMSFLLVIFVLVFSTVQSRPNTIWSKLIVMSMVEKKLVLTMWTLSTHSMLKKNDYAASTQQSSTDQEIKEDTKFVGGQGNDYASPQDLDHFLKEQEKELEEFLSEKEKDE